MNITMIGRGNIGGGLADLWERAGHQVTRLGRGGGDVGARSTPTSPLSSGRSPRPVYSRATCGPVTTKPNASSGSSVSTPGTTRSAWAA